jgi:deoxyribonuclease V
MMVEGASSKVGKVKIEKLIELQRRISEKVVLKDSLPFDSIQYVAGVDQAFFKKKGEDYVVSACVVMRFPSLNVVREFHTVDKVTFPYIPTFLMFREGDPAVKAVKTALEGLENAVVLVDGSGIAHPRRCGLATYIAVETGIPTIGITKRKLYGEVAEPDADVSPLLDGENGEIIGYTLKPCKRCKHIFISSGGYISPETSLKIVKVCIKKGKLPEPIRLAHNLAAKAKSDYLSD